ncbi:MAG: nucleotidyltransferase domain-containing protein [Dehalococcoidia bacterium]
MPLSKHHIDTKATDTLFDVESLAARLEAELPQVVFAYLYGSAASSGVVAAHSDLDIAIFVEPTIWNARSGAVAEAGAAAPLAWDTIYDTVYRVAESIVPGVRCDLGILNGTEPVFRFEVLKGRLLFCRDQEQWLRFYSITSREYESQLFHYEKQRRYRLEAQS